MTDTPPDGGRRIGLHWEAPAVPTQFGCLGSHPVQVYRSFHRLTDYLRFTGQNLLVYPILGVRGPLMASEYERFSGGPAIYAHCQGWLDMVLALCERRSLRFLPELLFHDSLTLRTRAGSQSEAAILAGTPTARMALWDDSISLTVPASTPLYSPSHPAFQEALLTLLDEFLTRYAKSPALEGAALRLGQRQSGWFGSIQCGYGDATIDQFEKDTKIAVPVDPASPSRFSLRARWLLTHQYDAWVRWRCTVVAALHAKLADRLHQARPGLKLILTVASPSHVTSQPLFGATSLSAERPVAQLLREAGIDLAAYAASPNIVVRHVLHPVDDAYLRYRYPDSGPLHRDGFVRDVNYLEEFTQPFRSPHGTAVAAMFRPFTPVSGALRPPKGLWWRPFGKRMTQPTQAGRAFLEPYAHALAALDTPMLSAGHSTLVTLGHEPHLHLFARAFKALPNRPFTDIHGLSDPVCGRQLQTQDSHTVYFVNRTAWPVDLAVAFTGKDVRLLDLATLDPVSLPAAKDKSLPAPMPRKFVSEHTLPAEPGPMPKLDARENVSGPLLQRQLLAYELANRGQISIITRLDRETSGLVLLALSSERARAFGLAMQRGLIGKEYLAVVRGWPDWSELVIEAPIIRQGEVRETSVWLKRCVDERGLKAVTEFLVQRRFAREGERFAVLRAKPRTGRTHQIRLHAAHAGFPLVGDKLYGGREGGAYLEFIDTGWTPKLAEELLWPRHALHAIALEFDRAGGRQRVSCPLAEDLAEFVGESGERFL